MKLYLIILIFFKIFYCRPFCSESVAEYDYIITLKFSTTPVRLKKKKEEEEEYFSAFRVHKLYASWTSKNPSFLYPNKESQLECINLDANRARADHILKGKRIKFHGYTKKVKFKNKAKSWERHFHGFVSKQARQIRNPTKSFYPTRPLDFATSLFLRTVPQQPRIPHMLFLNLSFFFSSWF